MGHLLSVAGRTMDKCCEPNYILSFSPQFFINQHSICQMSYLLFMTPDINLQAQCQDISLSDPTCATEQQLPTERL